MKRSSAPANGFAKIVLFAVINTRRGIAQADEQRVDQRVGMIHHQQQRPASRNAIDALDVNVSIVPAQRDTRDRAKQNVHATPVAQIDRERREE